MALKPVKRYLKPLKSGLKPPTKLQQLSKVAGIYGAKAPSKKGTLYGARPLSRADRFADGDSADSED